jgi:hypothetical protein
LLHAGTGSKGIYDWNLNAPYFSISTPSTATGSRIRRCRHSWNLTAIEVRTLSWSCGRVPHHPWHSQCYASEGTILTIQPGYAVGGRCRQSNVKTHIKHVQSIESLGPKPALNTLKRGVAPRCPLVTSKPTSIVRS